MLWLALLLPVQAAEISGRIQYTADSPIGAAGITLINQDTGIRHVALSNLDGYYLITGLQPGVYKLMVRKDGFKTLVRMDIKIDVDQQARIDFTMRIGMVEESIVVEAERNPVSTEDASVSTVVDRDLMASLPLNGRGLLTLLEAAPGVVVTPASSSGDSGQFSVSGQRADTNYITVDGISVNGGIGAPLTVLQGPGNTVRQSVGGALPSFTAIGSMHDLVSVEALDEFRLQTAPARADSGRMMGGQLELSTRSGTNEWHGALFEHVRNEALDATDWFANSAAIGHTPLRFHDFGGTLGGPIRRNRTFFFFSQESLILNQASAASVLVPSAYERTLASAVMAPMVNALPLPNGADYGQTGLYTGPNQDRARVYTTSLRIDHTVSSHLQAFARYNRAPSWDRQSLAGDARNSSLKMSVDTATAGLDAAISPQAQASLRFGYVRTSESVRAYSWGAASGADPGLAAIAQTPASQSGFYVDAWYGVLPLEKLSADFVQRQWNLVGSASIVTGRHALRLGGDFRSLTPDSQSLPYFLYPLYIMGSPVDGQFSTLLAYRRYPASLRLHNLSLFAEDVWKISESLTLSAGVRFESNPPPVAADSHTLFASLSPSGDASSEATSGDGAELWKSGYTHLAPRLSLAWHPAARRGPVLRAAAGIYYDLGFGPALQSGPAWSLTYTVTNLWPWLPGQYQVTASSVTADPSYTLTSTFRTPYALRWNATVEQALARRSVVSISYVGARGSHLLWGETLTGGATAITNLGFSHYHGLQAQLRTRAMRNLQLMASSSWSHSSDNASNASGTTATLLRATMPSVSYYGNSDFDVRLSVFAAFAYELPHLRGWLLGGVFRARTGFPINVLVATPDLRPNLTADQPVWVADTGVPGGRRLNSGAFSVPAGSSQGNLGRNAITGPGMSQLDISLQRQFALSARLQLQLRLEAFNALNHANFGNPDATLGSGTFGRPTSMLNSYLGSGGPASGLNPALQIGGPRALQLGLRLRF